MQYWVNFILSIAILGMFCHSRLRRGIFHDTVLLSSVVLSSCSFLHIFLHSTFWSYVVFSAVLEENMVETEQRTVLIILENLIFWIFLIFWRTLQAPAFQISKISPRKFQFNKLDVSSSFSLHEKQIHQVQDHAKSDFCISVLLIESLWY